MTHGATSTSEHPAAMPYPGPRPFRRDEHEFFFGRDREVARLSSQVIAHSVTVLYSSSGAGKSSLLEAGLVRALETRRIAVLPSIRFRRSSADLVAAHATNPYVDALIVNWSEANNVRPGTNMDFSAFIDLMVETYTPDPEEPFVLIVDQFEELFTEHARYWEHRGGFFEELQRAINVNDRLRVVLSLREDYLAMLDPFVSYVSNRLQCRFRLERLGEKDAIKAIEEPLVSTPWRFEDEAARYIVDQLRTETVQRPPNVLESIRGEYVEPVQLQVVCTSLWSRLQGQAPRAITRHDVEEYGHVDRALAEFFSDVVEGASTATGTPQRDVRLWCEEHLITPAGTRNLVWRGSHESEGLSNDVVDELISRHLVRPESRPSGTWLELGHDRLIEPIREDNRRKLDIRQPDLAIMARRWSQLDRPNSSLLRGPALTAAEEEAIADPDSLSDLDRVFVKTSRRRASRDRRRRGILLVAAAVILVLLSTLAVLSSQRASESASEARASAAMAEMERQSADNARLVAEDARLTAEEAENDAKVAALEASAARDDAELAALEASAARADAEATRQEAVELAVAAGTALESTRAQLGEIAADAERRGQVDAVEFADLLRAVADGTVGAIADHIDFVIEAESAPLSGLRAEADATASGGVYVVTTNFDRGSMEIAIDVPADDVYVIWARVHTEGYDGSNSFYLTVDDAERDEWDISQEFGMGPLPTGWLWELVSTRCGGNFDVHLCNPLRLPLTAGEHRLAFGGREINTRIDVVVITNNLLSCPDIVTPCPFDG